jgi:hypothetical protein
MQTLALYRPGIDDPHDPFFAAALAHAERDPELGRWLRQQQDVDAAFRRKFAQLPVPAGLEQQILFDRKVVRPSAWWERPVLLAAAAAAVVLAVVAGYLLRQPEPQNFAAFRTTMARLVSGEYKMMLETKDQSAIRQFLAKHHSPADYQLTKEMEKLPAEGCALVNWHRQSVSLVCLDRGADHDLFLFIIDRAALPDPPPGQTPRFIRVGDMTTASWSLGDRAYVLATRGSEDDLRKFL